MEIPSDFMIGSADTLKNQQQKTNADLSSEDFLQILASSIKNPSFGGESGGSNDSTDYISQMVQFSMMDQLTELTQAVSANLVMTQQQQGLNMMGKEVTVLDDTSFVNGKVEKVRFMNGYATIQVNGKEYSLNDVVEVEMSNDV
ncbi:flagellar hook capping FlgD N-terminal domain-containing protein [Pisciglobus halotolerans]|uniref:Flagellar basal-body rod modification protein FlgD n=1 Tax=Pisciglobus halotolerans TaxID=745365 RepID=A0A1I3AMU6_9LACT|nr:flagellar hook capping FlgD N-terminal domain-containing protein [Pisciglobus halotolerans]SFH51448.1 flagellar basal-body rod modification protein FlgD [Pisciglobus halotolerans]